MDATWADGSKHMMACRCLARRNVCFPSDCAMNNEPEQKSMTIDENKPRPYNLEDPQELKRLYRETRGYLQTCHYKHGTDWEGRMFAIEALKKLFAAHPTPSGEADGAGKKQGGAALTTEPAKENG